MEKSIDPFEYEVDPVNSGQTALAGLLAYLDLAAVCGLTDSIRRHLTVNSNKQQGWTDEQIIMALVLLNMVGGESIEDLRILEGDEGFGSGDATCFHTRFTTHETTCFRKKVA